MIERIICKLCGKAVGANNFNRHVMKDHQLTSKQYYDQYVDGSSHLCKASGCPNERRFVSIVSGYSEYCSLKCCYHKGTPRNNKIGEQKKNRTFEEMYGIDRAQKLRARRSQYMRVVIQKMKQDGRWKEKNQKLSRSKKDIPRPLSVILALKQHWKGRCIGSKNPNYKGGRTSLITSIAESVENKQWRETILQKFSRKCVICRSRQRPQVHHLDSLSHLIQEYRITKENWRRNLDILFNPENGTILCYKHHNANNGISLHSVFGRKGIQKNIFLEYIFWCKEKNLYG